MLFLLEKTSIEFRQKAEKAYNDLISFLKSNKSRMSKVVKMNQRGEVYLPARLINQEYSDLIYGFVDIRRSRKDIAHGRITKAFYAKGKKDPSKHWIVFPVIKTMVDLQKLESLVDFRSFVHEYNHFLDEKRRKKPSLPKAGVESYERYSNSPEEFNAHLQEGFAQLEKDIRSMSEEQKYVLFQHGYKKFLKKLLTYFDENFIDSLNDENYKRFLRRSYDLFNALKQE